MALLLLLTCVSVSLLHRVEILRLVACRKFWYETEGALEDDDGNLLRGYFLVWRASGETLDRDMGPYRLWSVETGFIAQEGDPRTGITTYRRDGTIYRQWNPEMGERNAGPWLWGGRDQEQPSLPRGSADWVEVRWSSAKHVSASPSSPSRDQP